MADKGRKGLLEELLREKGITRQNAEVREVEIPVKTKVEEDGEETELKDEIKAELPFSLADAVALYGEGEVFRKFINAHVVFIQGQRRNELRSKGTGKTRARASYMESLEI